MGGGWLQWEPGGWLGCGVLVYATWASSLLALCLVPLFDIPFGEVAQ